MPDLPSRREREDELAAALLLVFEQWRPRFDAANLASGIGGSGLVDWTGFRVDIAEALRKSLAETYRQAAEQTAGSKISPENAEELARRAEDWAASHAPGLSREISETTRAATELGNLDPWTGQSRAESIAITETSRAITAGNVAAIGLMVLLRIIDPPKAYWATEDDADVCSVCEPLDGEPEEAWMLVAPGGPPAHPNCRCWLEWR